MKHKIIIILCLILVSRPSLSQLALEGTFNDRFKTIQLDNGEIKYLKYNTEEQMVYIHNLDQSEWKKVRVPLPKEHLLDEIKSISQTTINKDTLIELIYSCVEYKRVINSDNPEIKDLKIQFTLNIINENGDMILKVSDSNEMEILGKEGKQKLLIYKHIGEGMDNKGQTLVYSLPEK